MRHTAAVEFLFTQQMYFGHLLKTFVSRVLFKSYTSSFKELSLCSASMIPHDMSHVTCHAPDGSSTVMPSNVQFCFFMQKKKAKETEEGQTC